MTFKLYLDPGHGGSDPGASGYGIKEKDVVLDMSLQIRDYLLSNYKGIDVKMSRTGDTYPSLLERTNEANAWGADTFLSVHVNAGGGTGFESYVYPGVGGKTKEFQDKVHAELMRDTYFDFRDRGQKTANLHVCRESHMPALLTENLFIDTKKDADFLKQAKQIKDAAINHAHGIAKFAELVRKKKNETKSPSGVYTVKSGDTLSEIAADHGTTVAKLVDINNIDDPGMIHPGQKIKFEGSSKKYHKVVSGDTVSELAVKFDTSLTKIKSWNDLDNDFTIYVGQKLRVK
ncbi:N-acetylmuramoyl-L-alanine amidase [Lentibacillus sp. Marseille-P4043]|uniref:N-acetylmuramoyl-L-alanine amidase n=1 Tax=Lentibacillus sp. Marseille-P4043 TaxID=2040293 RepID=UPI000D0AE873|nr:N-acetylmuramoyl-L-alanine amidase [Lentibacillus sp. Marseille-P4043]